jgi:hypothetical protein
VSYYPYTLAPNPSGDTTGATDTAAIQAAISGVAATGSQPAIPGMPNCSCLLFPCPALYYINAPVWIYGRTGLVLRSFGRSDTNPAGQRGTEFRWVGGQVAGAPQDAMWEIWSHRCSFEGGFAFSFDSNNTPPLCGIRIDSGTPAGQPLNPVDTTGTVLDGCLFYPPTVAAGVAPTFWHVDISRTAQDNCDIGEFRGCVFNGGQVGLRFGSNSNCKSNIIDRCQFNGCAWGTWMLSGSFVHRDCVCENCGVDVENDAASDFCVIENLDSEGAGLCASMRSTAVPVTLRNCRWSGITGPAYLNLVCDGMGAVVDGCYFTGPTTSTLFAPNGRTTAGMILRGGTRVNGGTLGNVQQFGGGFVCHELSNGF